MTAMNPQILDSLYAWLCESADAGAACPGNQHICDRYGFKSMASASGAVKKLEMQGKIEVTRFNQARQVRIVATGECTAAPKMATKQGHAPVLPALRKRNKPPSLNEKPSPRQRPLTEINRTTSAGVAPMTAPAKGRKRPRGQQCQWIEGLPTRDNSCKCLAKTPPGEPYCPSHKHRAHPHAGDYIPGYMKPSLKGLGG